MLRPYLTGLKNPPNNLDCWFSRLAGVLIPKFPNQPITELPIRPVKALGPETIPDRVRHMVQDDKQKQRRWVLKQVQDDNAEP